MILQVLKVDNWRNFHGPQIPIHFRNTQARKVTVIHAGNGAGKTSLLNALLWLFTGDTTPNFLRPKHKINNEAIEKADIGTAIVSVVSCRFEHEGYQYDAERRVEAVKREGIEETHAAAVEHPLVLKRIDSAGSYETVTNPNVFVNQIIPPAIREFFFFDGESLVKNKFDANANQGLLAGQMQRFFGLDKIQTGIKLLKQAKHVLAQEITNAAEGDAAQLAKELGELQEEIEQKQEAHDQAGKAVEALERQRDQIDQALARSTSHAKDAQRRDELKSRLEELEKEDDRLRAERRHLVSTKGHLAFLGEAQAYFAAQISELRRAGRLPSDFKRPFLERILSESCCICGRDLELGSKERTAVEDLLEQSGLTDIEENVLRMAGREGEPSRTHDSFARDFQCIMEKQSLNRDQRRETNDLLRELSDSLLDSGDVSVKELEKERKRLNEELASRRMTMGGLQESINRAEERAKEKGALLSRTKNQDEKTNLLIRQEKVATAAHACLDELFRIRDETYREKLRKRITDRLRQITTRSKWSVNISEDYHLEIKKPVGEEYVSIGTSGAESQCLAVAFVGSIIEEQKSRLGSHSQALNDQAVALPVIMDAPFGQLGNEYRIGFVEYIHSFADQVVAFVSSSQWSTVDQVLQFKEAKHYLIQASITPQSKGGGHQLGELCKVGGGSKPYFIEVEGDRDEHSSILDLNNDA